MLHRHHVRGVGQPLLFGNGFSCGQRGWRLLTPALAAHYQLILFDQLGAGYSDRSAYDPPQEVTLASHAQDVIAICQALQLHMSPHFLNEPGYYGGFERPDLLRVLAEMHANYVQWASTFATMLIGQHQAPALSHELVDCATQANPGLAAQLVQEVFWGDFRPHLPQLRAPTLLLQCPADPADPADPAVPEEVSAYLVAHLPCATLVALGTTGHCPHLTAPAEVAAAISASWRLRAAARGPKAGEGTSRGRGPCEDGRHYPAPPAQRRDYFRRSFLR